MRYVSKVSLSSLRLEIKQRLDQNSLSPLFSFLLTSPFTPNVNHDMDEDKDEDGDKDEDENEAEVCLQSVSLVATVGDKIEGLDQNSLSLHAPSLFLLSLPTPSLSLGGGNEGITKAKDNDEDKDENKGGDEGSFQRLIATVGD